jgi:hypothetical protein
MSFPDKMPVSRLFHLLNSYARRTVRKNVSIWRSSLNHFISMCASYMCFGSNLWEGQSSQNLLEFLMHNGPTYTSKQRRFGAIGGMTPLCMYMYDVRVVH